MRHHYIPSFYLSQWVGEDGRLCQFSRPHGKVVAKRRAATGVGWQEDLYAQLVLPAPLQQWFEQKFLLVVDQRGSDAFQILLQGGQLPAELRTAWSRFMMSLLHRTPDRIAHVAEQYVMERKKLHTELGDEYDKQHADDDLPPTAQQKAAAVAQQHAIANIKLLQQIMDSPRIGQHLNGMRWTVLTFPKSKRTLLTSDKPVSIPTGLAHNDAYIGFPLSPDKLFVAANSHHFLEQLKQMSTSDLATNVNKGVVTQAQKYVYGTNDYQIHFVDKYLRK